MSLIKAPVFPTPEPNLYSDYGFDPQIDLFQVMEEARRRSKRSGRDTKLRSIDSFRFTLQKPISKDEAKTPLKRRRWWRSALGLFWKRPKPTSSSATSDHRVDHLQPAPRSTIYSTGSSAAPCRMAGSGQTAASEDGEACFRLVYGQGISSSSSTGPIYMVT